MNLNTKFDNDINLILNVIIIIIIILILNIVIIIILIPNVIMITILILNLTFIKDLIIVQIQFQIFNLINNLTLIIYLNLIRNIDQMLLFVPVQIIYHFIMKNCIKCTRKILCRQFVL
ncbi:hypothetical protein EDEG_01535 [Edhazardia aedis USNM 41457]|uniref:Uncharacterized protein n=1 Tax=Edhazardia aedis (strain USNM 41457) TaxID=1003232 RepID=J9DNP8_EDHAE|nr:hypothetical protein EDEG_01535 [Edhazardia aedis USNM 41457]|eukprot:EJW04160.1 hypothetical protein EDEG_01535 [Edhazardia aedis USNM 41457]